MKRVSLSFITLAIMIVVSITSFAGTWKQDSIGWWYENDDGSYTKNAWQVIEGKEYYFNENGYLLVNTITPDNFQVDTNGVKVGAAVSVNQVSSTSANISTGEYWLSATGTKYHKIPNCGKMNPSKARKVSFEEAQNYTACDKCF